MACQEVTMAQGSTDCLEGQESMISTLADLVGTVEALVNKALLAGGGATAAMETAVDRCLRKELKIVAESESTKRPEELMRWYLSDEVDQRLRSAEQRLDRAESRQATIDAAIAHIAKERADAGENAIVASTKASEQINDIEERLSELSRRAATHQYVAAMAAAIESRQLRRDAEERGDMIICRGPPAVLALKNDRLGPVEANIAERAAETYMAKQSCRGHRKFDAVGGSALSAAGIDCEARAREVLESMSNRVGEHLELIKAVEKGTASPVAVTPKADIGKGSCENSGSVCIPNELDRWSPQSTAASWTLASKQSTVDSPITTADLLHRRDAPVSPFHEVYLRSSMPTPNSGNKCTARGCSESPVASQQGIVFATEKIMPPFSARPHSTGRCHFESAAESNWSASVAARPTLSAPVKPSRRQQRLLVCRQLTKEIGPELKQVSFTNPSTFSSSASP
eukprot:TRINITY_DN23943_c0_g1_i1.p1 TRINITY_DN23943_c0_g1~~TRINITY_DN23943_c0_g1_i1.p1  ORF type:complete len:457 (-),score=81.43 TRINITY_DN23943_c0_g1_i1:60-1430(-)